MNTVTIRVDDAKDSIAIVFNWFVMGSTDQFVTFERQQTASRFRQLVASGDVKAVRVGDDTFQLDADDLDVLC